METKVLQVFYGKDCLPYKDKERSVHFPIVGAAIQGASNTTKIRFYFDQLVEEGDQTTTWVVVSKLPNGKIGSEIVETELDSELNEHYALFTLKNFYTQAKGDLFLSLQGYQGGVQVETDPNTGISQIIGTPTIQATGSIKLAINYATQLVGSGETANINFQKILADLGTKLGIRAYTERVDELPTTGQTNVFYAIYDDPTNPNKLNIYVWNETTQSYVWVGDNTLYLGDYYTKEQGEQFESVIDNRVTSVENELSSVASGSPKGVYDTLADLQAAYPTGTTGIYVVLADNNWYYWNGTAWTSGGTYLAGPYDTELDEESTNAVENKVIAKAINNIQQHFEINGTATNEYEIIVNAVYGSRFRIKNNTSGIIYAGLYDNTDTRVEILPDVFANSEIEFSITQSGLYIKLYFEATGSCIVDNINNNFQKQLDNLSKSTQQHFEISGVANTNIYVFVNAQSGTKYRIKNNSNGILYAGLFSESDVRIETIPDINPNSSIVFVPTNNGAYFKLYFEQNGSCVIDNLDTNYQNQIEDLDEKIKNIQEIYKVSGTSNNGYFIRINATSGTKYKITNKTNGIIYSGLYDFDNERLQIIADTPANSNIIFTANVNAPYIQLYFEESGNATIENVSLPLAYQIEKVSKKVEGGIFLPTKEKDYVFPLSNFEELGTIFDTQDFSSDDWRSQYVGLGYDVVFNKNDNKYYLLYSGNNGTVSQIGVATSTNLINWTDYGSNPVLEASNTVGDYDYGGATFPQLLWFDNKWVMFYVAFDERGFEQGNHYIAYAESTDLIHWTKKGILISKQNFVDAGYNFNVFYRPRVKCFFGRYYMFINAGVNDAAPNGPDESVYVLVADNPLGEWKVIGCAIDATVESSESNYQMCADPDVIFNGVIFLMCYWGGNNGIRWAYSTPHEFPLVWHFLDKETQGGRPLLIPVNDEIYMIYNYSAGTIVKVRKAKVSMQND